MTDADRTHDIVVWGATGVAGRFVAEYLTERYAPDDLSLAVGGRSPERLEQLVSDLTGRSDAWDDVPVVVGDATDPESLRAIAGTRGSSVRPSVRTRRTERRWSTPASRPARTTATSPAR